MPDRAVLGALCSSRGDKHLSLYSSLSNAIFVDIGGAILGSDDNDNDVEKEVVKHATRGIMVDSKVSSSRIRITLVLVVKVGPRDSTFDSMMM